MHRHGGHLLVSGRPTSEISTISSMATQFLIATRRLRMLFPLRKPADTAPDGYGVPTSELNQLLQDFQMEDLEKLGGVEGLAKQLCTNSKNGLDETEGELHKRREAHGSITYPKKAAKGFRSFVWNACKDTTLNILMVCALVSLATGIWTEGTKAGWYEGTSIGVAVLLVIIVTAVSDYKQALHFHNLSVEKENSKLEVLRAGRRQTVPFVDLVVGDIVPQVPADGLLMEEHSLSIDESAMTTRENLPVQKDNLSEFKPFPLSGCEVHVGLNTECGSVMASVSEDDGDLSPVQIQLSGAATLIGKVGLMAACFVLVALIVRYFAVTFKNRDRRAAEVINDMAHIFSIAVTIVVVAVPEGLPLAVTLTLAYTLRKMMADKSLVRNLAACETMGSATTICSDKTGTLTTNKMTVTRACVGGEMKAEDDLGPESLPAKLRDTLVHSICLNSSGNVTPKREGEEPAVTGSPTDAALLTWGVKLGMNFRTVRHESRILHVETFNSENKRAGVICKSSDGEVQLHWKGAAEIILDLCTSYIDANGNAQPMTEEKELEFSAVIESMAAQALRCIAFAYRPFTEAQIPDTADPESEWKAPDQNLILMAIAGIKDPCRHGVRQAVEKCQRAGVKVRMVTGDNIYTAKAIAVECGILTKCGLVLEGKDFRKWDDAKLNSRALDDLVVMARSSPSDKLKLVRALKERRGDVVAVTGDGANDAPALEEADIGLSMGIVGTEAAKESSDITILDDNFTSMVKAVNWGRSVRANVQKCIQFQLTVNVVAVAINFIATIISEEAPLTAVQLLWANLIMDTMFAFTLAAEAPADDLMDRAPIGCKEPLITNIMWRNILGQALYQITVLLILTYRGVDMLGLQGTHEQQVLERNTLIFTAFVFCQLFNEMNARRPEKFNVFQGILKSYLFLANIAISIIIQAIIVTVLHDSADTTVQSTIKWWTLCVAIGFVAVPWMLLIKCCPVPTKPILGISCISRYARMGLKRQKNHGNSGANGALHGSTPPRCLDECLRDAPRTNTRLSESMISQFPYVPEPVVRVPREV